ncbi:cotton fiber protein [Carex rostrata]
MEKPSSLFSSKNGNNDKPIIQAKNISILVVVISIPILYVSFLHIPPSTLFKDTTFWFLMSNSIIIFIALDMAGTLFAPSLPETCENKLYEDFVTYSKPQSMYIMEEPPNTIDKSLVVEEKLIVNSTSSMNENRANKALALVNNSNYRKKVMKAKSLDPKVRNERSIVATEKTLRRSITQDQKRSCCNKSESHDYEKLSDEELNRRVEEFIRRYYRDMKLQLNNESV